MVRNSPKRCHKLRWGAGTDGGSRRLTSGSEPPEPFQVATEAQAARFLGRCLSYEETAVVRSELPALLSHGNIDWLPVIYTANKYFLTPALHFAMGRKCLTHLLPPD